MPPAIPAPIAPETRLLICCARTTVTPDLAVEIRALLCGTLNWDVLLAAAAKNSVAPLVEWQFRVVAPDLVPSLQMNRLASMNKESVLRTLLLTGELLKIVEALEAQGLRTIPYKGPVLAVQAYGDLSLRAFEDLDILVAHKDIAKVHETMQQLGYQPSLASVRPSNVASSVIPGEYKYYSPGGGSIVEFHSERTLRHFPVPPNLESFARDGVRIALSGREILTLSLEDALVALCVHGAKDFWERLLWIADVAQIMQSRSLDWDRVFRSAEIFKAQRMLHLGMILAEEIFDALIPSEPMTQARDDSVARVLACQMERQLLIRSAVPPLSAAGRFAFRRRSVPGLLAGWRYALRLATAPAQDDVQMVQLPQRLRAVYALVRPVRLLFKSRANG